MMNNKKRTPLGRMGMLCVYMLLLVSTLNVFGQQQKTDVFTLNVQNSSMEEVFKLIQAQSNYRIFYLSKELEKALPVSLSVKNISLENLLKQLFNGQPFGYKIEDQSILVKSKNQPSSILKTNPVIALSDTVTVMGRVSGNDGVLPGASVRVKGSGHGVTTDANGYFVLTISKSKGAILMVSNIGFRPKELKVTAPWSGSLNVQLERSSADIKAVEIVSTGYQNISKERATGSFAQISGEVYNRNPSSNVLEHLDGVAASLQFDKRNGFNSLRVRGLSTLNSQISAPLIVLDNFPYSGTIDNINPNDVLSITVLKDAPASSIWGARAGNGVIVITTKKGKYQQPLKVSFNHALTFIQKPDVFYFPQISSSDFIDVEQYLFNKGFYEADLNNTTDRPVISPVVELLHQQEQGKLTPQQVTEQLNQMRGYDLRQDFEKYLIQNAVQQQYSANLNGGGENYTYLFSVGYDKNLSSQVKNDFQRVSIRSANTFRPVKNLEFQAGMTYTQTTSRRNNVFDYPFSGVGGGKSALPPYIRLADEKGNHLAVPKNYRGTFTDTAGNGKLLNWNYVPLDEVNLADHMLGSHDLLLNLGASYQFRPYLSVEVKYQYEKQFLSNRNNSGTQSYYTRDLINRFSQIDGETVKYMLPYGDILSTDNGELTSHKIRGQLNFNKQWDDKHTITALGGAEINETHTVGSTGVTYGYNGDHLSFSNVDLLNPYPIFAGLSSDQTIPSLKSFSDVLNRFVSVYGNFSYSLLDRYTLSGSVRKDASNLFGVRTNQRGVPLWSAGMMWEVSKEGFYALNALPTLRLRATYGYQGNVSNDATAYSTISRLSDIYYTHLNYGVINSPANPLLRWEKVAQMNGGVDFATKGNVISGSLEYYQKHSKDLLSYVPLDPTTGFGSALLNAAKLRTEGIDVQLSSRNITGSNFKWESNLLMSYVKNTVAEYYNTLATASAYVGDGLVINPLVGKAPFAIYSYRFAGLDGANGDPQGYVNHQVSKDYISILNDSIQNAVYNGSSVPVYFGALRNSFTFKNWMLSFNIKYEFDFYFRKRTISYHALFNQWTGHGDFEKRWKAPGDETRTSVPSMSYPADQSRDQFYAGSEATVLKGDNIRLQDIRLSYQWQIKSQKRGFQSLNVYGYLSNVCILWKANKAGLDPDYNSSVIPPSKGFTLGISGTF